MNSPASQQIDDDLWSAMGDPTRRQILDALLVDGFATATSLSRDLPITRQAVSKHLDVLERAALVHSTSVGRERRFIVDDDQLARAAEQLATVSAAWDARLARIRDLAESIHRASTDRQL